MNIVLASGSNILGRCPSQNLLMIPNTSIMSNKKGIIQEIGALRQFVGMCSRNFHLS